MRKKSKKRLLGLLCFHVSLAFLAINPAVARDCNNNPNVKFSNPTKVNILGYEGHAMEPFISSKNDILFFNSSNAPNENTNILYAQRIDDNNFKFIGELVGVNSNVLDGVASLSDGGEFYFITLRSYEQDYATIYSGNLVGNKLVNIKSVSGVAGKVRGEINFDAEISRDGQYLFYVEGIYTGGVVPASAKIAIAKRSANGFVRVENSDKIMAAVNKNIRQYAPAISANQREIFFNRLDKFILIPDPRIYRAVYNDKLGVYSNIEAVEAIDEFAEGPTITKDGCTLYYHAKEGDKHIIKRVVR